MLLTRLKVSKMDLLNNKVFMRELTAINYNLADNKALYDVFLAFFPLSLCLVT